MKSNTLLLLIPALLSGCGKPMGTTKAPPPPAFGDDQYKQEDEPTHVPYDLNTVPEKTTGTASLDDKWWTAPSPCPEGSALVGGAPPEHQRVGCKTEQGKNVGKTTDFFESGSKKEEGQYVDHFAEGVWTAWDEKGHRISETSFLRGNQDGLETLWYPAGEIKSQRNYKGGKREGVTYIWDDRTRLRTALSYRDGKKHGVEARWGIDGEVAKVIHWDDGQSD